MRKILLISLSVFLVIMAGGFTIAWFMQAAQIKKSVEQAIANINGDQHYITYESVETSGFPKDVMVSIVKPHFAGRLDLLLQNVRQKIGKPALAKPLPAWTMDALLDGNILLGVNAVSDHYTMTLNGNWHYTNTLAGQATSIITQSNGPGLCALQMERSGNFFNNLWNFRALTRDGESFLQDFRELNCSAPAHNAQNETTKESLSSAGPSQFYVTSAPAADMHKLRFYLKLSDIEITKAGDKLMDIYMHAVSENAMPANFSANGKQNIEIDMSYAGPKDFQNFAQKSDAPLDIDLSKFIFTSQIAGTEASFHFSNHVQAGTRSTKLAFKADSHFEERYDVQLRESIRNGILSASEGNDPSLAPLKTLLQNRTPDQFFALISPAIPNLHSLGKLVQELDMNYQGSQDFKTGDMTLTSMDFSATPYGVTGSGTVKKTQSLPMPAVNISLACRNCLPMIDDIAAYAQRVQQIAQNIAPDKPLPPVNMKLVDGVKQFLQALASSSQNAAGDTLFSYVMASDGGMGLTINGKKLDEVMALYSQYLASAIQPVP